MSNSSKNSGIEARESVALSAGTGTVPPQGTPRACKQEGAVLSNTAPAKYTDQENITPLRCAVDSLYISYQGQIRPEMEELLTFIKAQAQHTKTEISSESFVHISDHKFEVRPKGAGRFSFVLDDNWFNIQLSSSQSRKVPLAYIQVKSELLTFTKLEDILKHLNPIIQRFGRIKGQPSVSRLDLCLDFVCKPSFDIEAIDIKQGKTRASQIDRFHQHKRPSGWRIGKGQIMGRVYNKSLEIKKSKKDYLKPLWEMNGWNGQTDVWRVEFQFLREFLASVKLNTPYHIALDSPSVWKYATTRWLQLVQPNGDTNESRWPVHPAWKAIAEACTNPDCQAAQKVTKKRVPKDQYLYVNGLAAISSYMAREGITDLGEALGEFLQSAKEYHLTTTGQSMEEYLLSKAKEKTLRYNTELEE